MNTALYIARRYLFAKKSTNAINIISTISVLGVFVGSAALIIILSIFNGFEVMVLKMFNTITPELVISPLKGKTFDPGAAVFGKIHQDPRIYSYTQVLSENALLRYKEKQSVGLVKGVSTDYLKNKSLDSITVQGKFILDNHGQANAVLGSALQNFLMVNPNDPFIPLQIFSPKRGISSASVSPAGDFINLSIPVAGIFEVQRDFDNVAIVPLAFARNLLQQEVNISSIELDLHQSSEADQFKSELQKMLGPNFEVKDRIEQNKALYNILGTEKWAVYIILTFILIIAIFNIIGSLTMLVIDKLKDIAILSSLGAGKQLIKRIFLFEGMMITLTGCIFGLLIGLVFCLLQQKYGMIAMSSDDLSLGNAYPVALRWQDFLLVFITVSAFSFMASALSSNLSVKNINNLNQDL